MQTQAQIIGYVKQVAKEECLDDGQTVSNIEKWNLKTITRILDYKIRKHEKELEAIPPDSQQAIDFRGKIFSINQVKDQIRNYK
jgi:hypothetical protein